MRNPNPFEDLDPAVLARVCGGIAQLASMIGPLIGMIGQGMGKKKGAQQPPPQQMMAQAPAGGQPMPPPQSMAPTGGGGGDGRVQVTVATGPAALEAIKSAMGGGGPQIG